MSYPQVAKSLWTTRQTRVSYPQLASNLTNAVRSILAGEPLMRIARRRSLVLLGVLCVVGTTPAEAVTDIDNLKLYAHSRLINYEQFQCFHKIITKESRWSYTARNGSHYGLGQMRSKHYRDLDPYRQIDATIKYVRNRYQTPCKAWAFHQERNWY